MVFAWLRNRRRRKLLAAPLSAAFHEILLRRVLPFRGLSTTEQTKLADIARILIAEKRWEGCAGLLLDDEIRVTIAGWASLLLLGIEHDYYAQLKSIIVYPEAYIARDVQRGALVRSHEPRAGEAWYRGPVVLSWDDVQAATEVGAAWNVVFHEFAHQLDMLDREIDGTPPLADRAAYRSWTEVMTTEFEQLRRDRRAQRSTLLDTYGATNEAEFFAVATECFFMQSREMLAEHPRLYTVLRDYFRQDPAAWPLSVT